MSYATVAELFQVKTPLTIGQLASDTGTAATKAEMESPGQDSNLIVQGALDSAAGMIDAALMKGGRYLATDLQLIIINTPPLYTNSRAMLVGMNCEIAMALLFSRKPTYRADEYEASLKVQDTILRRLAKGEDIFPIPKVVAAGTPKVDQPSVAAVETQRLMRDRTQHYYPIRTSPSG